MATLAPFLPPHLLRALARDGAPDRLPAARTAPAALLLSDISGFTALTERLQSGGRSGAEEVVRIVNAAFAPAIQAIEGEDGSVVTFGGDALFSVFEGPACVTRACRAAEAIRAQFDARGPIPVAGGGEVTLGLAQAVHHGALHGLHLGREERRAYVATGRAVGTLARMEERARTGQIQVSRAALAERRREAGRGEPGDRPPGRSVAPWPGDTALAYVPPHVQAARLPFEGEFRRVAMMFLEVRSLAPARLQAFFLELLATLQRYEGTLVGPDLCPSGVRWLCAFGAPLAHEDDPDRAARAAVDLLRACPRGTGLRGGIHAGTAAYIQVGIAPRSSLEIMGDVTNTAARAMVRAAWGEVLVTEEVRRLVVGVDTEPRGSHVVKGKAAALTLHAVTAARPVARQIRVSAPMIGRDAELRRIEEALELARSGRGSAIGIGGEPGLGKSRLKYEAARVARAMGFEVHEGRAVSFGGMAYWAVGALLRSALGLPAMTERDEVLDRVTEAAARLGLGAVDRHHLGDVLGARHPDSPIEHLQPKDIRLNAMLAIRSFGRALARQKPRLFVLEDMHWADGASAEAAERLAAGAADAPYVLLLLYRPGFELPPVDASIVLHDLADDAVEQLLRAYLGVVPGAVTRLVRERSGGNPFYVEEVVRHLLDAGILATSGGGYELAREIRAEDLPDSIERLIAARLDRLSAGARRVAQYASVIGRSFLYELLAHMPQVSETARPAIEELCQRELTFELRRQPHLEYVFKHALTRDVAYSSILTTHRRRLHADVADALEEVLAAERGTFVSMLGYHREQAGDGVRARQCYLAGARAAVQRYGHEEAEGLYRSYLRLVDAPDAESIQARNELAQEVLQLRGRMAEAEAEHRRAREEASALGDGASEWASLRGLGNCCWRMGRMDEAREATEQALAIARMLGDRKLEGIALGNLGIIHKEQARFDEARQLFQGALVIHRDLGSARSAGVVLGNLASLHHDQGRLREASQLYEEAYAILERGGHRTLMGITLDNLADLELERGSLAEALALHEQALVLHREVGDRRAEGRGLCLLADVHLERGSLAEAEALYLEAQGILRDVGDRRTLGQNIGSLAGVRHLQGRLPEARQLLEEALAIHDDVGNLRRAGGDLGRLARILFEEGRMDDSRGHYERALAIHRETGNRRSEGIDLGGMAGLVLLSSGDAARADALAVEAEALLDGVGDQLMRARVLCTRGHATLARGGSATELLGRAQESARSAGTLPEGSLSRDLAVLARAEASLAAGHGLVSGYALEDLTAGQIAWLRVHRPAALPG